MNIVRSPRRMQDLSRRWAGRGLSIGFVPTMGALHAGHLSLIRRARAENDRVVVSIFVNPTQFGPQEDFGRYPRPFSRDGAKCRAAAVDALYHPNAARMYPESFRTYVEVSGLSEPLCGGFRPGHFRGVATVVLKLLEQTRPERVYFGEKDFQQLAVLRRMVRDLDLPVRVVGCPTVREPDGLALSSRNAYLSPSERAQAARLIRALRRGARLARAGKATVAQVEKTMLHEVEKIPGVKVDYLSVVEADTLVSPRRLRGRLRLLGAIRIGRTRLIDNIKLICDD